MDPPNSTPADPLTSVPASSGSDSDVVVTTTITPPSYTQRLVVPINGIICEYIPRLTEDAFKAYNKTHPSAPLKFERLEVHPEAEIGDMTTFGDVLPEGQHEVQFILHSSDRLESEGMSGVQRGVERLTMDQDEKPNSTVEFTGNDAVAQLSSLFKSFKKELDGKISTLEGANVELQAEVTGLKEQVVGLQKDNAELEEKVQGLETVNSHMKADLDRHWKAIRDINRRALLDEAADEISTIVQTPCTTIKKELLSDESGARQRLLRQVNTERRSALSLPAFMMIFSLERLPGIGTFRLQSFFPKRQNIFAVRQRRNEATHRLDFKDVSSAVLEGDLEQRERTWLSEVFEFVFHVEPASSQD